MQEEIFGEKSKDRLHQLFRSLIEGGGKTSFDGESKKEGVL